MLSCHRAARFYIPMSWSLTGVKLGNINIPYKRKKSFLSSLKKLEIKRRSKLLLLLVSPFF